MNADERSQFSEYLRSPLHSNRPQLAGMMEIIANFFDGKEGNELSNETYWSLVYHEKAYNANLLNRLLSEMTRELKGFLSLMQFKNDLAMQQVSLLREYRDRGWEDVIPKEIKIAHTRLDRDTLHDEEYYEAKLQLAIEQMHYDTSHLGKDPLPIFQSILDWNDIRFLLLKLKYSSIAGNHDRLHSMKHRYSMPGLFAGIEKEIQLYDQNLLKQYFELFQALEPEKRLIHFPTFVYSLTESRSGKDEKQTSSKLNLGDENSRILFAMALNLYQRASEKQKELWNNLAVRLYEVGLEKSILIEQEKLGVRHFLNYSNILVDSKNWEKLDAFLDKYASRVKNDPNENAAKFAQAIRYRSKREFSKSLSNLLQLKNALNSKVDIGINLRVRGFICMVNLELEAWEDLHFEANSFRTFLKRNKIFSQARLTAYNNFCSLLLKFLRIKNGSPDKRKKGFEMLNEEIEDTRVLAGKPWLLENVQNEIGRAN